MKIFSIIVSVLLSLSLAEVETEEGVLLLNDENWEEELKNHPKGLFIFFYAPWCGVCKKLRPLYKKAAATLAP